MNVPYYLPLFRSKQMRDDHDTDYQFKRLATFDENGDCVSMPSTRTPSVCFVLCPYSYTVWNAMSPISLFAFLSTFLPLRTFISSLLGADWCVAT